MAAPNIISLSDIRGKTNVANVTTISTSLVSNNSGSNTVYKISSLYISNIDGVNPSILVDIIFDRNGVGFPIANAVPIPADSTLLVVDKNSGIYLEESDSIFVYASANDSLVAVASYEELA
jgi:hypothetical protein